MESLCLPGIHRGGKSFQLLLALECHTTACLLLNSAHTSVILPSLLFIDFPSQLFRLSQEVQTSDGEVGYFYWTLHTRAHIHIYTHAHNHVYTHTHIETYLHTRLNTRNACIHIHPCIRIYLQMHTHKHTHTHTLTAQILGGHKPKCSRCLSMGNRIIDDCFCFFFMHF